MYDPAKAADPKLGELVAKIAELLVEYDVMGSIVVANAHAAEYFTRLDPGFSILSVGEAAVEGGSVPVRIRAKTTDYASQQECHDAVQATCSALVDITVALTAAAQQGDQMLALIGQHVEIEIPALAERAQARDTLSPDEQPANLPTAVSMLTHRMSPQQTSAIAQIRLEEFLTGATPTLGTQLIGVWQINQPDSRLVAHVREAYGIAAADAYDTAQLLLTMLWLVIGQSAGEKLDPDTVIGSTVQCIYAKWEACGINPTTGETL